MTDNIQSPAVTPAAPQRCVIIIDAALPAGKAANAAAVMALTIGQRHPGLAGRALIDADGVAHPGLIPIGIAVLAASQDDLSTLRSKSADIGCDVIDFPVQGQETTNYDAFCEAVGKIQTRDLRYLGIALVGEKKPISRLVANLGLLK